MPEPIPPGNENRSVPFSFEGRAMQGPEGEPLAAVLRRAGIVALGVSPRDGTPRGAFCFMGSCQECRVLIDGTLAYACRATVRQDMQVTSYVAS
ncbi:2Fe-2S iron-sulfur cluster-binding protein [Gluconacetobacter asukensis]|uniref:(2Fe-2S)-binding protein n=1 Tax=Gluconacetobacter asukensis TaxID=1017181 RepID=A0A7W4J1T9_9PROT|nr:2Fe-2S iron-sulfur cluster-binding protein [Gluconacetobacter asukensis]MBB2173139.1 (2Fe-2S)-binding protein [Gluconacetobacter asukensis]